jgi:hypothetical protein
VVEVAGCRNCGMSVRGREGCSVMVDDGDREMFIIGLEIDCMECWCGAYYRSVY